MIVIGHRGAKGYEAENTLRSFELAIEMGVEMVEFDVHALNSGETVVIHDHRTERTTNGHGYVQDMSFEGLRKLKTKNGESVPTLEEVLDLVDRRCKVFIELKNESAARPVARILEKYCTQKGWDPGSFIVLSFNHVVLQEFKELAPHIAIGSSMAAIPLTYAQFAQDIGAKYIVACDVLITKAYVADAHRRGISIYAYTVNEVDELNRLKKLGVDGVFSDYPDVMLAALATGDAITAPKA
jgi:glycerophosphoryl diester phosphodiesterase